MDNLYCEKQEVIHTVLIKSLRPVQNDTVELLSLQVCFKSHLLKSGWLYDSAAQFQKCNHNRNIRQNNCSITFWLYCAAALYNMD